MTDLNVLKIPLLLASASPRRKYLLEEAGFSLRIIPADIEETYPEDLSPYEVPAYLSHKKGNTLLPFLETGEVILAADSVVILEDRILGKPQDRSSAIEMLQRLSNQKHEVVTGVTLMNAEKEMSFSNLSEVFFHPLNAEEIEYYVDHYHPFDKAGSYGIQEWIGWCKIRKINGSYSNIMGLPVSLVYEKLQDFMPGDRH